MSDKPKTMTLTVTTSKATVIGQQALQKQQKKPDERKEIKK